MGIILSQSQRWLQLNIFLHKSFIFCVVSYIIQHLFLILVSQNVFFSSCLVLFQQFEIIDLTHRLSISLNRTSPVKVPNHARLISSTVAVVEKNPTKHTRSVSSLSSSRDGVRVHCLNSLIQTDVNRNKLESFQVSIGRNLNLKNSARRGIRTLLPPTWSPSFMMKVSVSNLDLKNQENAACDISYLKTGCLKYN